jgi:hypothetical protein
VVHASLMVKKDHFTQLDTSSVITTKLIVSNMNTSVQMLEKNYKSNSKEHIIADGEKLFKDQYTKLKVKKSLK